MATSFERVAPTFYVRDLDRAAAFWRDELGFAVTFTNGDPPAFAIVGRDAAEMHLVVKPELAGTCHCHLLVTGLAELAAGLAAGGTGIIQPLKSQTWGLRDIVISDADGNTIEIAEPLDAATHS